MKGCGYSNKIRAGTDLIARDFIVASAEADTRKNALSVYTEYFYAVKPLVGNWYVKTSNGILFNEYL